jgi:hypothetical protein
VLDLPARISFLPLTDAAALDLPNAGERLDSLGPDGWHRWPYGSTTALVRRLDADRYVAVVPMLFTFAVVVGEHWLLYVDRCSGIVEDRQSSRFLPRVPQIDTL